MPDYAGWPTFQPLWSILGQPTTITSGDGPAFSNAAYTGLAGLADTTTALTSGVGTAIPIPVPIGALISKVTVFVGAQAASTPTHSWACLYAGSGAAPARLGTQSTDGGTAAIAASGALTFTLGAPVTVTAAVAPYGFIYASIGVTVNTTMPSLATVSLAAAVAYQWFTNSPVGMGAVTHGSALGAVAPTTIASPAAQAATPIVVLT